jgi:RNA exonuclease 4
MNTGAAAWAPSTSAAAWAPAAARGAPAAPTLLAIDVECVATSRSPSDRAVCLIAAVDAAGERVFFEHVLPSVPVASPLTLLTGVTREDLAGARGRAEVVADLKRRLLGPHVTLVGHGLRSDIAWLQLRRGVDFAGTQDTAKLFAVRDNNNFAAGTMTTPSLRHLSLALLQVDMQSGAHSPDVDARFAMQLYLMHAAMTPDQLAGAKQMILATPKPPPFAKMYPYIDGCALSHRSAQYDALLDECRRVVFLDLDGVLNRTAKNDHLSLASDLVENLIALLAAGDAVIRAEAGEGAEAGGTAAAGTAAAALAAGKAVSAAGKKRARVGIVVTSFWRPFLDYVKYVLFRKGVDTSVICGATSLDGMHAVAHSKLRGRAQAGVEAGGGGGGGGGGGEVTLDEERGDGGGKIRPARYELIQRYLDEHPWITRCCILDDRPGASNAKLAPHFVQTNAEEGLTPEKVAEAIACLEIPLAAS